MTAGDGDAEPLRVPPWLAGLGADPDRAAAGGTFRPDPAATAAPDPIIQDDPVPADETPDDAADWAAAPDRDGWHVADEPSELRGLWVFWRSRLIVAGVAAAVSLLVILAVAAYFGDEDPAPVAPPVGLPSPAPSPTDAPPPTPTPAPATPSESAPASSSPAAARTTSPPPKFGPVSFEAEAPGNTLGGSAWVDRYPGASGGSIVRNLGDWGSRDGDGVLRFNNVDVPVAGTYTLKLYHVNIDNERTRTAVVTVDGRDPQRVTLNGGSTCCTASTLKVQLRKGGNTISVANPDGHAPSVDRIVLSLP
ncbi:hypothetical protein AB0J72_55350 [Dactylosporangium sp. NPDC049742]|uniref:hypothetical protein n=1 Tax=Dactylosporangium sp. NPDC049742 TaxID=3154737 RepID=UPI00341335FD